MLLISRRVRFSSGGGGGDGGGRWLTGVAVRLAGDRVVKRRAACAAAEAGKLNKQQFKGIFERAAVDRDRVITNTQQCECVCWCLRGIYIYMYIRVYVYKVHPGTCRRRSRRRVYTVAGERVAAIWRAAARTYRARERANGRRRVLSSRSRTTRTGRGGSGGGGSFHPRGADLLYYIVSAWASVHTIIRHNNIICNISVYYNMYGDDILTLILYLLSSGPKPFNIASYERKSYILLRTDIHFPMRKMCNAVCGVMKFRSD